MFTDSQKARIRLVLGFPSIYRYKHTRLEAVMDDVAADEEALVVDYLSKIDTVDAAILEAGTTGAGIKRVDEVWFAEAKSRVAIMGRTGRQYIARISVILGVPPYSDYYGTQGYLGDTFSGLGQSNRGGGGFYGLG